MSGKPRNLCFLSAFPSPFYSTGNEFTNTRENKLHNLLSRISNINKLERPHWDFKSHLSIGLWSKIIDDPEKQNEWKWFIFICSYRSSMLTTLWDERGKVKAGTSPRTREKGPKRMAKGKKSQISEASRSFMQSHSNENELKWQRCNDLQWHNLRPRLNPGMSHLSSVTPEISLTGVIYWTSSKWNLCFFFILFGGWSVDLGPVL